MNYIRHLNNFLARVAADPNIKSGHISLYMAIFRQWNFFHFKDVFMADRRLLMKNSKVGSKLTYTNYLKDLHTGGYIRYFPAIINGFPPSISVRRLDDYHDDSIRRQMQLFTLKANHVDPEKTDTEPVPDPAATGIETDTGAVPDSIPLYKQTNIKQENSVLDTPMLAEVEDFFKANGYPAVEAKKFWLYNESKEWQLADGMKIKQWEPLAHKWMLNDHSPNENKNAGGGDAIDRDKNYNEPL